jgi:uncharacterized protein (TIGR03067 family)
MKMLTKVAVCLVALLATTWGAEATGWAQDLAALSGQWKPVSGTLHGQSVPGTALQSMSLTVTGSSFNAASGSLNSGGTITLTPGTSDQATFAITTGADANRQLYVKWRVSGNQLTLAFSEQGPPADFNSTAANKYLLMVYDKGAGGGGVAAGAVQGAGGTGGGAGVIE